MSKKAKLSQLNKELSGAAKKDMKAKTNNQLSTPTENKKQGANPSRGERGDFLKVTITLHPSMLHELKTLGLDRKLKGMKDTDASSLIREALTTFLDQQGNDVS